MRNPCFAAGSAYTRTLATTVGMKNWKSIKEDLYYEDGSLRDIYILNTSKEDWKIWIDLVNEQFEVDFFNGRTQKSGNNIDIEEVFRFWDFPDEFANSATINLGKVIVKCHFFIESEIENDIDPREVKEEADHYAIMDYLLTIKEAIKKKVILTPEMAEEIILLEI
jgi:hypothetical protein